MSDRFTREERSWIMSRVRGGNTAPEKIVRSLLHAMGFRFRLHVRKLPGNPDIVLTRFHKIVFVHGCFWHGHKGCRRSGRPETNVRFWNRKIDGNIRRDTRIRRQLRGLGWSIMVVWQCRIRKKEFLQKKLVEFLGYGKRKKRKCSKQDT